MPTQEELPPSESPASGDRLARLLAEYAANIELYKHDDDLRQKRIENFLNTNTILLVALGTLVTLSDSLQNTALAAILIAFFGFPISLMWARIQDRNLEYVRFRRYQMRSIEKQLGDLTTISNQWVALQKLEPLTFKGIEDVFEVKKSARRSSAALEGRLPLVIAAFWVLVLTAGVAYTLLNLLGGV